MHQQAELVRIALGWHGSLGGVVKLVLVFALLQVV